MGGTIRDAAIAGNEGDEHDHRARRGGSLLSLARTGAVVIVIAAAWIVAFQLRFDGAVPAERLDQMVSSLPLVVLLQLACLQLAGATRHSWRYTSIQDLVPLGSAVLACGAALALVRSLAPAMVADWPYLDFLLLPYGVVGAYTLVVGVGLTWARLLRRILSERADSEPLSPAAERRRILLIGAGRAGVIVARELQSRPDLGLVAVGFVDDDPATHQRRISQLDVLGATTDLAELVERYRVDDLVITIAAADGATMRTLIERCEAAGKHPLIVPGVHEIVTGSVSLSWFRPVEPEDLLGRDPVDLDLSSLSELLTGATVAVTGAGGSIGSELCRQIARFSPTRLVLIERAEPALWAIHRELTEDRPADRRQVRAASVVPAIADVTDAVRIEALLAEHRPSVIFHAAAHKHVPMMEANPGEAIKNNVIGTQVLVEAAADAGVEHVVNISTDKAVNPTSVMGATKRLAERYVQHVAARTGRPYVSVRFGNVLGSTGSVVPIFEEQIAAGGPVKVTDPEMRRYFMTIPEAAQLVIQAAALGTSGEILVLDMGEPVRIVDLAESMIRLTGHEPYTEIPIEFTGLRPGEKLFEELSLTEEAAERTRHPKVWIGKASAQPWATVHEDLRELVNAANRDDPAATRALLASHVPEFIEGETTELPVGDLQNQPT